MGELGASTHAWEAFSACTGSGSISMPAFLPLMGRKGTEGSGKFPGRAVSLVGFISCSHTRHSLVSFMTSSQTPVLCQAAWEALGQTRRTECSTHLRGTRPLKENRQGNRAHALRGEGFRHATREYSSIVAPYKYMSNREEDEREVSVLIID